MKHSSLFIAQNAKSCNCKAEARQAPCLIYMRGCARQLGRAKTLTLLCSQLRHPSGTAWAVRGDGLCPPISNLAFQFCLVTFNSASIKLLKEPETPERTMDSL